MKILVLFLLLCSLQNLFAQEKSNIFLTNSHTVYKDTNGIVITKKAYYKLLNSKWYYSSFIMDTIKNKVLESKLIKYTEEQYVKKQNKGADYREKGKKAPHFKTIDFDGNSIDLEALEGKVVVINFWFLECSPCVKEIPQLNLLVKEFANKDVLFLSFVGNKKEQVLAFMKKRKLDFQLIEDNQISIRKNYAIIAFPTNIVLDKNGNFYYQSTGYNGQLKNMETAIKEALEK